MNLRHLLFFLLAALLAEAGLVACSDTEKQQTPEGTSNNAAAQAQDSLNLEKLSGSTEPQNVIFILSDDHRYDFMSSMDSVDFIETPNLDRLAEEGAQMENAFVSTSLCSPSRASILTGEYAHSHEIIDNQAPAPGHNVFFPQYLQRAGYQTGFVGKWHMGNDNAEPRRGFDYWVSFEGQGEYYNPMLNINGEEKQYQDSSYITNLLNDFSFEFLDDAQQNDKPFFLYLSHKSVHSEFYPAPQDSGRYANVDYDWPRSMYVTGPNKKENLPGVNYEGIPKWVKEQRYSWHGVDYAYHGRRNLEDELKRYSETLYSMDRSIGELMAYLDSTGLAENTAVIYMGDNGFCFGEHGLIDKRQAYEASMRVPMLMRWPGKIEGGTKVKKMVQNIDIGPTILEMAGLQTPDYMHGQSFTDLVQGDTSHWRDKVFYEYYWDASFPQTPTVFAVRGDRYKYIFYHGIWDTHELYDIKEDPEELNNLIASEEHQEIAGQLKQELFDWLKRTQGMQIPLKDLSSKKSWTYNYKGQY